MLDSVSSRFSKVSSVLWPHVVFEAPENREVKQGIPVIDLVEED
jgi:hypothetical protein